MDIAAEKALGEGARQIGYQYDLGSTTRLKRSVAGEVDVGAAGPDRVALLARSLAPEISCGVCQASSAQDVCPYGGGFVCVGCRQGHACDANHAPGCVPTRDPRGNLPPPQPSVN